MSNDYFSSGTLSLTLSMPPSNNNDDPAHDKETTATKEFTANNAASTSIFILISARALGHLGFALSLFAVWLGWLLPASVLAVAAPAPSEIKVPRRVGKSSPRQLTPTAAAPHSPPQPPRPVRRLSVPVDITPILATHAVDTQPARRVYFADAPAIAPFVRRNTMPETTAKSTSILQSIQQIVNSSPRSSVSALPSGDVAQGENGEEAVMESDSSRPPSRTSSFRSACLPKLKFGFNNRTRSESVDGADRTSIASADTGGSDKSTRRTSGFLLTRNRNVSDVTVEVPSPSPSRLTFRRRPSPARPSTSPSTSCTPDILSPSFLSRKQQKRVSAPIPRTMPYGAPYFATPPILLDNNYASHLKSLRQFEDEVSPAAPVTDSDSEVSRGRAIRRVNLNTPQRSVPHRRSASAGFNQVGKENL